MVKYQVGGSLPPDAPSYISRQADKDLYKSLKEGEFCYILNPRQMGKSSLLLQTMNKLKAEGIICVNIDLSVIGNQNITSAEWYNGVINTICTDFSLFQVTELSKWHEERKNLSSLQRLSLFIQEVLLQKIQQNIVICIDEIDTVQSLEFPFADFFALIRYCYNKRAEQREYKRLTFAIFGVATPDDLIKDPQRTPFNIGCAIALNGFKLNEALPLAEGLSKVAHYPEALLGAVLAWTEGQPFLTQKLCKLLATSSSYITAGRERECLDKLVQEGLLTNWEAVDQPQHLRTIRDRLLSKDKQFVEKLLRLYKEILQQGKIAGDESREQAELRLSGLVVNELGVIRVSNPIYEYVFDLDWVKREFINLRPYSKEIAAWIDSGCQDESKLLRGQVLKEALAWAKDKSLGDRDYQFLTASQQLSEKEVQKALAVETQSKKKVINRGLIALATILTVAISVISVQYHKLKNTNKNRLSLLDNFTKIQFKYNRSQLDSFLLAMKVGQDLKTRVDNSSSWENYPTISPLFFLQTILQQIQEQNQLQAHDGLVKRLSFSPDGQLLATWGEDDKVKLWKKKGKLLTTLPDIEEVGNVYFSADGQFLVTTHKDDKTRFWNLSGELVAELKSQGKVAQSNNKYIIGAEDDGTIRVLNLLNQQVLEFNPKERNGNTDGEDSITRRADGKIELKDSSKDHERDNSNQNSEKSKSSSIRSYSVSPDEKYLAITRDGDARIEIWLLPGGDLFSEFNTNQKLVYSLNFTPDGKYLVSVGADYTVRLWNLFGKQLDLFKAYSGKIYSFSLSPQLKTDLFQTARYPFAIGEADGTVKIASFRDPDGSQSLLPEQFSIAKFSQVRFSPDRQHVAIVRREGIQILDTKGDQLAIPIKTHPNGVASINFSNDGQLLASTGYDSTVQIRNIWDMALISSFNTQQDKVWSASFSPDGQQVATAGQDGTIKLWDLAGNLRDSFSATDWGRVMSVSFSPDGQQVATAGQNGQIRIWNLSGKMLSEFKSPQIEFNGLKFSPDGKLLATAGEDGLVNLFVVSGKHSGQLLAQFQAHETNIVSISFISEEDREYIITVGSDKTVSKWPLESLDELLQRGCNWLEDYFITHPEAKEELEVCQN